ncbi:unnamed protein product [Mytilus coruscus]|uniref:TIR domain-containing protein n=1 Tax=Mytilus coruscus TaxID=42192 RepID=A0A6J8EM25_MYTCO|nr:unnamed protein product [Mytilus coruscus]
MIVLINKRMFIYKRNLNLNDKQITDIFRDKDYALKPLQPFERRISWEIYRNNSSQSWSYTGFDAKFDKVKLPVCREIYYRVEGEDVDITCRINDTYGLVTMNEDDETNFIVMGISDFDHFKWYLGNGLTIGSLNVQKQFDNIALSKLTLRINDLAAENFNQEITLWGYLNKNKETLKVKFGSFFIYKQKEIFNFSAMTRHYNASSNKSYLSETKLPYTFVILPRGLAHFAVNKYKELQKDVRKLKDEGKTDWRDPWRYFADDLRFDYFISYQVQKVIFMIILVESTIVIGIFIKVYCKVCVHHLAKIILKPRFPLAIRDELRISKVNIGNFVVDGNVTHDIMIIASDNNYDFVVKNLYPFFKDLGLSILFPQTDIHGGQSNFNGYSQAVVSSVIYVVVATTDFENDPRSNNFILSDLILPRMYEQRRNIDNKIQ